MRKNYKKALYEAIVVLVLVVGGVTYLGVSAYKDFQARVWVSAAVLDFTERAPAWESEIKSLGRMNPRQERSEEGYVNVEGEPRKHPYLIDIGPDFIRFTFAGDLGVVAGNTFTFRAVTTEDGIKWQCNHGTVELRYRPANCREENPLNFHR